VPSSSGASWDFARKKADTTGEYWGTYYSEPQAKYGERLAGAVKEWEGAPLKRWLEEVADGCGWWTMIVKSGYLVAEWGQGLERNTQIAQASIDKSFISCLLGIAIDEGRIAGLDAPVVDYFPEMMDIGPAVGPRPGRYAFEKDRAITFRQLASQTSGFLKPDQYPGRQFHYQTFGINIITHAIATVYGLYDSSNPDRLPGGRKFLDDLDIRGTLTARDSTI